VSDLLKQSEVLARLRISRALFWKLRNQGFYPAVRISPNVLRWRKADVDRWIEEGTPKKAKKPVLAERSPQQLAVAARKDRRVQP
jgi:predicted DNA-binding transcriptional regulator AlpA